ncbi:MAG: hypothetical protein ABFS19_05865 [Thermodesulfobacteriota bacterium]
MKKLIIFFCLLLLTVPAYAGSGKQKHKGKSKGKKYSNQVKYKEKNKGKGKSKHSDLPPGLQKNVARGKPLPPGWQKKIGKGKRVDDTIYPYLMPVPQDVRVTLPPLPRGVSYRKIDNDILKIRNDSREILDIFPKGVVPVPAPVPVPVPIPLPGMH